MPDDVMTGKIAQETVDFSWEGLRDSADMWQRSMTPVVCWLLKKY